jgi:hypothetical protein
MLNSTKKLGTWVVAALALAGAQCALGNNGVAHGKLPNGKPFQNLQNVIQDQNAALQAQIDGLQAQLDANDANDAALGQMIGVLQVTVGSLEQRMGSAEGNLQALNNWRTAQDALTAYEMQQIAGLQAQVANDTGNINTLFQLYSAEQLTLAGLGHEIDILNAQGNAQAADIADLRSQFQTLNAQYQGTRAALASGCPSGSAVRQVIAGGPVLCQPVAGPLTTATVSTGFTADGVGAGAAFVACPPDTVPTGGGVATDPGATVLASFPKADGWDAATFNPIPLTSVNAAVFVRCVGQ